MKLHTKTFNKEKEAREYLEKEKGVGFLDGQVVLTNHLRNIYGKDPKPNKYQVRIFRIK